MMKSSIRQTMIEMRNQLSSKEVLKKSLIITNQIKASKEYKEAKVVAIFYPMGNEVNLLSLVKDDKQFVFPRVEKDGIHFYPYSKHQVFQKSKFGVMEPTLGDEVNHIDFMLTPALAISKDLYRIGYGKGYYDQFLQKTRPEKVVGVIFDFQYIESFQVDAHDQPCDLVYWG